jgi:plasmid stabilization system protein ParE
MSAHIWFSPLAVTDVEEIGYYVACENDAAAPDLADWLFDAFSSLAENSKMG